MPSNFNFSPKEKRIVFTFINILCALLWLAFAYDHIANYFQTAKITSLLFFIVETVAVAIFISRRYPKTFSFSLYDTLVGFAGTFIVLLYQPVVAPPTVVGTVFVCIACLMVVPAMLSLGRSFGIVAANRGIKRNGLYRFVRHPIYFSYIFLIIGYVIDNGSFINMSISVLFFVLMILRIYAEEKHLMNDEAYRRYAAQVRWRLVPGVF